MTPTPTIPDAPTASPLTAALAAAQAELNDPVRAKLMRVPGRPDRMYAGLDDLLKTVRPVLAKHGIAIVQTVEPLGDQLALCTQLRHASGEVITSHWPLKWGGGPQDQGSALSYGRRYTLEAICGVAATSDDDAEDAQATTATTTPRRGKPTQKAEPPPTGATTATTPPGEVVEPKKWTEKQQAGFFADLARVWPDHDYDVIAMWCEAHQRPRPSVMQPAQRQKLLVALSDAELRTRINEWAGATLGSRVVPAEETA